MSIELGRPSAAPQRGAMSVTHSLSESSLTLFRALRYHRFRTLDPFDHIVVRTMRLHYELHDAGWATVTLECGDQKVEMTASYLHDSLRDLASAARALSSGAAEARVVFMDEPGEHQMLVRRTNDKDLELEILWYDDWQSWKMHDGPGTRRLLGRTSVAHVRGQVLSELRRLLRENGESIYLEKWAEHPFPMAEMRDLEEAG